MYGACRPIHFSALFKSGQRAHFFGKYLIIFILLQQIFFVIELIDRFRFCNFLLIENVSLQHFANFDICCKESFYSIIHKVKSMKNALHAPGTGQRALFRTFYLANDGRKSFTSTGDRILKNVAGIHILSV